MKIDKNIPIPNRSKYPFAEMEVGDSIFIDKTTTQSSVCQMAYTYGKKNNKKFTSRTEGNGVRIWRIK